MSKDYLAVSYGSRKAKYALGDLLRDKVTGFSGVVMVIALYSTGCLHYGLSPRQPKKNQDGGISDPNWIWYDESRLELVKERIVDFEIFGSIPTSGPFQVGPQ